MNLRAITGPDYVPRPVTRAERVKTLAATQGATFAVVNAAALIVTCDSFATAEAVMRRVRLACDRIPCKPQWSAHPRPDFRWTYLLTLTEN